MITIPNKRKPIIFIIPASFTASLLAQTLTLALALILIGGCSKKSEPTVSSKALQTLSLRTERIQLEVTPQLGGRPISFSLSGNANVLKVGKAVWTNPEPTFDEAIGPFSYSGHVVWFGPQSEWWKHQTIDLDRQQRGAAWPPDPYTTRNVLEVVNHNASSIVLKAQPSPVNGLQVTKKFELVKDNPNAIKHTVLAKNVRPDETLEWDIWFNTRVPIKAEIFVPIDSPKRVRTQVNSGDAQLEYTITDGLLHFNATRPNDNAPQGRGKLFITPSQPWIASVHSGQIFVKRFVLLTPKQIHSEHAQVEIYINREKNNFVNDGFELEVHSALTKLVPGDSMSAFEQWSVYPYTGEITSRAINAFLSEL